MPTRQPNVLVFFTDQQRWDTCSCYGNPMGLTPHLDAMARRGTRFQHAFTCQPVCGPVRATLQTGLYARAAGVWRNGLGLAPTHTTIAQCFQQAGYETGYIGKWHLSAGQPGAVPKSGRAGYQHWIASNVLEFTSHPNDGVIFGADNKPIRLHGYRVDAQTDLAINFLRRQRDGRPFFLFLSYLEPHHQNDMRRFVAPDGYAARYRDHYVPPDLQPYPEGDWRSELPDYYGICASLDENLGRVIDELRHLGELDNTILLFTSDHGCHFRTRNTEYKRSCHDSCLRVPMAAQGPGFDGGRAVPELVSLVDVPPTLLAACGLPVPSAMQGHDMTPLAAGRTAGWADDVFAQISESQVARAVRTARWTYCAEAPGKNGNKDEASDLYVDYQLYDLQADPHQLTNLLGRSDYAPVLAEMRQRLKRRMAQAGEAVPEIRPI